jgi:protein-S-isoprenylcysteine O-methyltransferase Ste14
MYVVYLLFFLSVFLVSGGWLTGTAGCFIIASLMTIRLKKEEAILLKTFGDQYTEYAARTPRFFIKVFPG